VDLPESKNRWYRATTMFVRFRPSARHHLQVSLVETARSGGKVKHDHVAGLGSIDMPSSPSGRIAFWTKLHRRLATLTNRISQGRTRRAATLHC
jgi:hypothetical protein